MVLGLQLVWDESIRDTCWCWLVLGTCVLGGMALFLYGINVAFKVCFHPLYSWFCIYAALFNMPSWSPETLVMELGEARGEHAVPALNSLIPYCRVWMWEGNEHLRSKRVNEPAWVLKTNFLIGWILLLVLQKCDNWPYSSLLHLMFMLWNIPVLTVHCIDFNNSCR